MEEEKAAAYYDELTRKGEGAARFKQGLGFSSNSDDAVPVRGSALPSSSSSFLSNFVRASSPTKAAKFQKQSQLETIQSKLKKKPNPSENQSSRVSNDRNPRRDGDKIDVEKERERSRDRDRHLRRRSRSRSRDGRGSRHRHRSREKRRRRSRSRSVSDEDRGRRRRGRGRSRSRSLSPRDRRSQKSSRGDGGKDKGVGKVGKERNAGIDYGRLIEGYDKMSPAERVKAKMKLQLSETAEKDTTKGMGSGWERFEFDRDAPLDDEEIEAAEDDAVLVKHIGQSFRFSAVEARREEEIKAAHDEAMFGASSILPSVSTDDEANWEDNKKESNDAAPVTSLISDTVLAMQQNSWRGRARKL
uniref:Uncharacterized protein n=1 Tax=Davidia involucrata TaxID=16924 RepID=A0A5B7BD23_DAVIN